MNFGPNFAGKVIIVQYRVEENYASAFKIKIFPRAFRFFNLREVRKALTHLLSIKTTSQTEIFLYIGKFDRGAILNKKPVSPRSDKRAREAHD